VAAVLEAYLAALPSGNSVLERQKLLTDVANGLRGDHCSHLLRWMRDKVHTLSSRGEVGCCLLAFGPDALHKSYS
jgi:hypothetical protein